MLKAVNDEIRGLIQEATNVKLAITKDPGKEPTKDPPKDNPQLAAAVIGSFVMGAGLGVLNATVTVAIQSSVEWNQRGMATGTVVLMRSLGNALGAAVFGGVINYIASDDSAASLAFALHLPLAGGDLERRAEIEQAEQNEEGLITDLIDQRTQAEREQQHAQIGRRARDAGRGRHLILREQVGAERDDRHRQRLVRKAAQAEQGDRGDRGPDRGRPGGGWQGGDRDRDRPGPRPGDQRWRDRDNGRPQYDQRRWRPSYRSPQRYRAPAYRYPRG